ncbi:MarR family winged helix-turn-helix transcriptional regulator [Hoeflea sp. TYP-13]|uniref:MarR family winged helix-turn-helix transcriptional regulator n=1 Tax=Hoeflea sp. TYP-13 TaxID=3230023 RepID=UPI0034C6326A
MNENALRSDQVFDEVSIPKTIGEIGLQNFVPYLLNRITGRYNQSLQDSLGETGLSVAKMRTLAVLSVVDGLMTNELSVYAVIEQSTLSRTLDALEGEGLIRREAGARDSRVRHIYITQDGRDAFTNVWPILAEAYQAMFAGIPADEHDRFVGTLNKILRNIRKHEL